ncbi:MAG TPA: hypothetical protein VGO03_04040 [Acidimicrobiia bacterium]|jgi:hypothetical protein
MAILHAATLTPTKAEIIASWLPTRPWAPAAGDGNGNGGLELVGAYRFDDPVGQVGIEGHLVRWNSVLLHVPLTYRNAPLAGADDYLLGTMQHSALGERWVYDGVGDPVFTRMLTAAAMTGTGQAVGLVEFKERWLVVPTNVRLAGGGWGLDRVAVDGLVVEDVDDECTVLRNDGIELRVARRPLVGTRAPISLRATWPGQDEPVTLAEVRASSAA